MFKTISFLIRLQPLPIFYGSPASLLAPFFVSLRHNHTQDSFMYYVRKRMEVAGCHRLNLSYQSKCSNMHGHNWIISVFCRAEKLNADGMVADFTHIKQTIHGRMDHADFNEIFDFNPTAENIARWVCSQIEGCFMVSVQESEGNTVLYVDPAATAADIAAASAL